MTVIVSLAEMAPGQTGMVVSLEGGHGMMRRLAAMGLHRGAAVIKTSSQPLRGPISVQVGNTEVAMGFGLARRVMVEVPG